MTSCRNFTTHCKINIKYLSSYERFRWIKILPGQIGFTNRATDINHVKIDVDGHEMDVIKGMTESLNDLLLKSVLIEVNKETTDSDALKALMFSHGFTTDNPFNKHPNHSNKRRGGNPENIIFTRKG